MKTGSGFMAAALAEAAKAARRGEVPIGAVLVDTRKKQILAADGNRTRGRMDPTAHAEMLVIRKAAARAGSERLTQCDLYVTVEPCPMCAQAISYARIRRLYFGAEDEKMGGVIHGPRIFQSSSCHHRPEVVGGIAGDKARALMQDFFKKRR
ncbi:MAG TPA: nucleoside deaminase [Sphingomonadales bacterium]|nr:nucleoside deaminase [Sphingomonadales bacterium]